MNIEVVGLTW